MLKKLKQFPDLVEVFAQQVAIVRIEKMLAPANSPIACPKILHAPTIDHIVQNNAVRANNLLDNLLTDLAKRESVARPRIRIDQIK